MTIRLYCDEDSMDRNLLRALLARGMDVTTALEENMRRILRLSAAMSAEDMQNRIEFLSAWG